MKSTGPSGRESRKIEASLVQRRKVLQCLDTVRRAGHLTPIAAEETASRLARLGEGVRATLIQVLQTERSPVVVGLAARTLERLAEIDVRNRPRCIAGLKKLVLSAEISDESRLRLLITLSQMGVDIADERYATAFQDFAAIAAQSREEMLAEIDGDEFLLCQLLEELGRAPAEVRVSMVEDCAQSAQSVLLKLYRCLGRSDDEMTSRTVVDCLVRNGTPAAAGILKELTSDALAPATRERAERAAKALRFNGVQPVRARRLNLGPIYNCLVTALDGVGSRMIWIARGTGRSGQLAAIHLMVNEQYGLKDCFGSSRIARTAYDDRVRSLEEPGEVAFSSFDYEYGLLLLRDALATNRRTRCPVAPQFLCLMDLLMDRSLEPEVYVPQFPLLDRAALKLDRRAVQESVRTLTLPELSAWFMISEGIYKLARRANRLTEPGGGQPAFRGDVRDQLDKMCMQILRSEIVPTAPFIRRRMELMADYFQRAPGSPEWAAPALIAAAQQLPASPYWAPEGTIPMTAAFTETRVQEEFPDWPRDLAPPEHHPFLKALARRSLETAQAALRSGYDYSQYQEDEE